MIGAKGFQEGHPDFVSPEARKISGAKISKARIGFKHTEESKKKISINRKGILHTEEAKQKISENNARYWLGKKIGEMPKEQKQRISEKLKGKTSPMKGRKHTKEALKKMSISGLLRWSKIPKKKYKRCFHVRDKKYINWRISVFTRDNWTCQGCERVGGYLEAHHIKHWVKYPKLRYEVENGVTLCYECHRLAHKKH